MFEQTSGLSATGLFEVLQSPPDLCGKLYNSAVSANGRKSWRYKYRFEDKERLLTLGAYPEVSLANAREKRDEAKNILRNGRDPRHSAKRKAQSADWQE